jgi:predicted dehydrogenase
MPGKTESSMSRRGFVQAASAGILGTSLAVRTAHAAGNARVRHAVIGVGGQGTNHVQVFSKVADCEVVAVCDIDPEHADKAASAVPGHPDVKKYGDFRELLDNKEIDSVSIATVDHWHAPVALAALKAGKHVYVEKPCAHNILEASLLAEAAKKTGKCVQHGTQSRSGKGIQDAVKFLRDGGIGKVRMAKAINHQMRGPIGNAKEEDPPNGVNYDLWLGPAPLRPFTKNRWHYNWHWFWEYGCGDIGNDGIHQIDVARWGLGVKWPKAVSASGGQLFYDDDHETPDTQVVTFEYDDCYLLYEMRLWTDYKLEGHDNGVVFYGDKGIVEVGRDGCFVQLIKEEKKKLGGSHDLEANMSNFIACVKADDPSKLNASVPEEGYPSTVLCHLGNIATRVGRRLHYDADKLACTGDEEATALFTRTYRTGYELPVVG